MKDRCPICTRRVAYLTRRHKAILICCYCYSVINKGKLYGYEKSSFIRFLSCLKDINEIKQYIIKIEG